MCSEHGGEVQGVIREDSHGGRGLASLQNRHPPHSGFLMYDLRLSFSFSPLSLPVAFSPWKSGKINGGEGASEGGGVDLRCSACGGLVGCGWCISSWMAPGADRKRGRRKDVLTWAALYWMKAPTKSPLFWPMRLILILLPLSTMPPTSVKHKSIVAIQFRMNRQIHVYNGVDLSDFIDIYLHYIQKRWHLCARRHCIIMARRMKEYERFMLPWGRCKEKENRSDAGSKPLSCLHH